MLGQLAPLVQSRTLLQGPEDLQEAKLSNEVGAAPPRRRHCGSVCPGCRSAMLTLGQVIGDLFQPRQCRIHRLDRWSFFSKKFDSPYGSKSSHATLCTHPRLHANAGR